MGHYFYYYIRSRLLHLERPLEIIKYKSCRNPSSNSVHRYTLYNKGKCINCLLPLKANRMRTCPINYIITNYHTVSVSKHHFIFLRKQTCSINSKQTIPIKAHLPSIIYWVIFWRKVFKTCTVKKHTLNHQPFLLQKY